MPLSQIPTEPEKPEPGVPTEPETPEPEVPSPDQPTEPKSPEPKKPAPKKKHVPATGDSSVSTATIFSVASILVLASGVLYFRTLCFGRNQSNS